MDDQGRGSRDLSEEENDAIGNRRKAAGIGSEQARLGLALSGGGIRSATFCFGVLRALARNGVLRRFDYLSTVSGGGYIGAALGRLFKPGTPVEDVERGLADEGSLLLWWLRSNGRFLIPAGALDLLQAGAGHLRGFLATQLEVAAVLIFVSALIVLPHLTVAGTQLLGSPWWWVLALPILGGAASMFAYWFCRNEGRWAWLADFSASAAAAAIGVVALLRCYGAEQLPVPLCALALLMLTMPLGWIWRAIRLWRGVDAAQDRLHFTGVLATMLKLVALLLALGTLDLLSWTLASWLKAGEPRTAGGIGIVALLIAVGRVVLPALQQRAEKLNLSRVPFAQLGHWLGLLLLAMIVVFWLALLQMFVFMIAPDTAAGWFGVGVETEAARWLAVLGLATLYIVLSGGNLQQLNRSSMHLFYRSRLTRTYVAIGNYAGADTPPGATRFPTSPLQPNSRELTEKTIKVTRLLRGDDLALKDYAPHRHGGPLHLINCCINQTVDDRTGTYNADRKGVALTVSSLGVETGARGPAPDSITALGQTQLSEWVAISGAAVSSGMGSLTSAGVAALSFLSGFRLGYWWRGLSSTPMWSWRWFGKYRGTFAEMLARFPGLRTPAWYLSDGGHFDNTGVYALLKRKLALIVLADCGADPHYLFADLENLIRKARVDFNATIEFIDPASLPETVLAKVLRPRFGTPDSIMPGVGEAHLLLARIRYHDGTQGALLVIKPRRHPRLPLDVAGYADHDPGFPQQSTGDQFFDEAQWESYCELGCALGMPLTGELLDALPQWSRDGVAIGSGVIVNDPTVAEKATRQQRIATTVGTSLGIGALASLLLAGWQAWDDHRTLELQQQKTFIEDAREAAKMMSSELSFTPELRVKLILLGNAVGKAQRSSSVEETLKTLAEPLEKICVATSDAELSAQCRVFASSMRGQERSAWWQRKLLQYRDWLPAAATVAPAPVAAAGDAAELAAPETVPAPPIPTAEESSVPAAAPPAPTTNTPAPGSAPVDAVPPPPAPAPAPAPAPRTPVKAQAAPSKGAASQPGAGSFSAVSAALAARACELSRPKRYVLYAHIHSESQRAPLEALLPAARAVGLATPGIENVETTATKQNRKPPLAWPRATVLYQDGGQACAEAIARWLSLQPGFDAMRPQAVALPDSAGSSAESLELWLPPPTAARAKKGG